MPVFIGGIAEQMNPALMPRLETRRLLLRPMVIADVSELLQIFSDARVMAWFGVSPFGLGEMEQWVQRNLAHQEANGYGLFSVILKSNGLLIGDCGLERMGIQGTQAVELGFDFRSDHWNRGYATEAATAVRDFAFDQLRLPRLISLIRVGNIASKRVAEKVGMSYIGEIVRNGKHYWKYSIET
jgi:RimJ/RimL family protein N-acetyltransferase